MLYYGCETSISQENMSKGILYDEKTFNINGKMILKVELINS